VPDQAPRLSVPPQGIRAGDLILRLPVLDDVDALLPAFGDPELREAGNLPAFGRTELAASLGELPALAESGRLLPLAAVEAASGEVIGAGILHHLDAERKIVILTTAPDSEDETKLRLAVLSGVTGYAQG